MKVDDEKVRESLDKPNAKTILADNENVLENNACNIE
jgi:hypothetical protein